MNKRVLSPVKVSFEVTAAQWKEIKKTVMPILEKSKSYRIRMGTPVKRRGAL